MKVQEILTEAEASKLEKLANDEQGMNALKKLFLFGLYYNGTKENFDMTQNFLMRTAFNKELTNEVIGADARACAEGIRLVEGAFEQLNYFKKTIEPEVIKTNPGR